MDRDYFSNLREFRMWNSLESGVDSALLDGESDPVNRQHVSRDPVVDPVRFGVANHVSEALSQDVLELLIHHRFFPEITLAVLNPLEVGGGYASGIRQD